MHRRASLAPAVEPHQPPGYIAIDPRHRRAAFIATALSVPIVVVVALALAPGSDHSASTSGAVATAVVSVSAPTPSPAAIEPCAQVESALPIQLDGNNPRQVHPYPDLGAPTVAWGDPPIVLQCGVARPKELTAGSSALVIGVGPVNWLPVTGSGATTFYAIDRSVYISVTVPKSYPQPPLATLSTAIGGVLPAVCHVADEEPTTSAAPSPSAAPGDVGPLCTQRP